jgi:putative ABC transport system permease protein
MRWFGIKKTIKLGLKSLWMHRLRSTLTTLGIVFGVCSVIAMLAIGEGASREAQAAIARLGSTNLIVETVKPAKEQVNQNQKEGATSYGLTYDDAECIHNTMSEVEVIVPVREINQEARYLNRQTAIKIIGTVPWYTETSPLRVLHGRFLSSFDLQYRLAVCVLDYEVAEKLFAFDDPLDKDVRVFGNYYRVVGIAGQTGEVETTGGSASHTPSSDADGRGVTGNIYIPLTTAKCRFTDLNYTFSGGKESLERVELQKIIVKTESIEHVLVVRDVLNTLLARLHNKKDDYHIVVPLELLREAARTRQIFSIVLGSIAAISLLVGGIGIMNIMLATVSERTREIGIRRALGAKKRDIIVQFLSETLTLTLLGGVLGIISGSIIPSLVTHFGKMPTVITGVSLVLAFGISGAVGIIFGLYPAYRAANMDPVESLRHE